MTAHYLGRSSLLEMVVFIPMIACYGAAIGGLVRQMKLGAIVGCALGAVLWFLAMPPAVRD